MPNIKRGMMGAAGDVAGFLAYGWGANPNGQLGEGVPLGGDPKKYSSPVQIMGDNWLTIQGGFQAAAGVQKDGTLWTWGSGKYAATGLGNVLNVSSPTQVGSLTNWAEINTFNRATAMVKTDGTLWCVGQGNTGRLGTGTTINYSSPVQIGSLTNWSKVLAGAASYGGMALKTDATLWGWGSGSYGRLGLNSVITTSSPVQLGTSYAHASIGNAHSARVKTDGTLWTCGYNSLGQCGDGTVIARSSPIQVGSLTNWSKVYCSTHFTSALKTDGTLWSWGRNAAGYLGDGTNIKRSSPVQIGSLTNWSKIRVRAQGGVAVKTDGTLWTWGENVNGSVGDGTVINRSSPVQIGSETDWGVPGAGSSVCWAIKSS
jgi:alpha-tubulin suppressor-like RCC1 family protein